MIAYVKLNDSNKSYCFSYRDLDLNVDDEVIVDMGKFLQFGIVSYILNNADDITNYNKVVRIASDDDKKKNNVNVKDAEFALKKCRNLVNKYRLNMKIIDATFSFNREQLLFRFVSDERVDFRSLAKELGVIFKTRIELRQVGIRDKAKFVGGIGPCGRLLCCNSFLKNFDSVSINMAKNQQLSLNPSKINGVCGRLLCCLNYENDNYFEYKKGMPNVGSKVVLSSVEYKVISIDIFNKRIKLYNDNEGLVDLSWVEYDSKK